MNNNFMKDARRLSSKVLFEPNHGNFGEIYSVVVYRGDANNLYIQNHNLVVDSNNNLTIYRKGVVDAGITTYNRTKKIGYFDGENTSFPLSKMRLASQYSNGDYNIAYSSKSVTDSEGYVINPETGERTSVTIAISLTQDIPTKIRFFELIGSQSLGEYPTEFSLSFAEPETGYFLSSNYSIHNNSSNPCIVDLGDYKAVGQTITLNIYKWSKPYSSVKIDYLGINVIFDITSDDLLLNYNCNNITKKDTDLDYGCKYNSATVEMFTPDKSYGKIYREKEKIDGSSTITEITKIGNCLNITDLLLELEAYKTKMSLYVKTEFDIEFIYVGKFFINKVDFNTQSATTRIEAYDIMQVLQNIAFYGFPFTGETNITLLELYNRIKTMLETENNIKIDTFNNKTKLYMKDIIIDYPKYNSKTVWDYLDKVSQLAQLYFIADIYNENNDIIILSEV